MNKHYWNICPECNCEVEYWYWTWGQTSKGVIAMCDVCADKNNLNDLEW